MSEAVGPGCGAPTDWHRCGAKPSASFRDECCSQDLVSLSRGASSHAC